MNIPGTLYPDGSVAYSIPNCSTHSLSLNDIREMCGRERICVYDDPKKCETKLYSYHEAKYLNHARLGQCPNCGANDWLPTFMLRSRPIVHLPYALPDRCYDELYEIIDYSCAYCGTRKEKDNAN